MKELLLEDHVLYTDENNPCENQVLVYYHPNGIHCDVFIIESIEYGGGVSTYAEGLSNKEIQELAKSCRDIYDFHRKITFMEPFKWKELI